MKICALGAISLAALVLSACGGMELQRTSGVVPTGSAFDKALFAEYLSLSRTEYSEGDYRDSDTYALRARSAAGGTAVAPSEVSSRKIPADKTQELVSARSRLMAALNGGARERNPADAAKAQAMFDCWLEEQEENVQPDHSAWCRSEFFSALAKIEVAPVAAVKPAPVPPAPQPETITIYFDFNKATLNAAAQREVDRAVARINALKAKEVVLEGHADRSGSSDYNKRLSQSRVTAVRDAIQKAGVTVRFSETAFGEDRPAVPTADNVRERQNREVVVHINP